MSETDADRPGFGNLTRNRESALVFAFTMLLAGLAAGWAGRALLAGEALTEQFWLVPVIIGLTTSLYAQARGI
jgi:anti-sigma factor RsiW